MSYLANYFAKIPENKRRSDAIAYAAALDHIAEKNPDVSQSIAQELKDQRSHLKLIASENYSSLAVQLAMGNLLTDKYAEGYPFHRFYAGCGNVDNLEGEACNLLKKLFGCEHAYVQPHSGADANLVAFWSVLVHRVQNAEVEKLGKKRLEELTPDEYERIRQLMMNQKIMGMSLNSGGHLTHGYLHNLSSKMMRSVFYDVDAKTGIIDYAHLSKQVKEEKPTILLAGYSAHPRKINFAKMREIADSVGAVLIVDMAHFAGLVAGQVFSGEYNPIPYADLVTSTTHKTLRGPRGGIVLCKKEYADIVDKGCPLVLGGPMPHVIAAKLIAFREASTQEYQKYTQKVVENAQALAQEFVNLGETVLTGGTDNHMLLLDVTKFGITGRQAESVLIEANLTLNRNSIPEDKNGPWYTSGIRIGTPAVTSLGMGVEEMKKIAHCIVDVLSSTRPTIVEKTGKLSQAKYTVDEEALVRNRAVVRELLEAFPLYPQLVLDPE